MIFRSVMPAPDQDRGGRIRHPGRPSLLSAESPFAGAFNRFPIIVTVAAYVALWKYKADNMKVIGVCALLGLIDSETR